MGKTPSDIRQEIAMLALSVLSKRREAMSHGCGCVRTSGPCGSTSRDT